MIKVLSWISFWSIFTVSVFGQPLSFQINSAGKAAIKIDNVEMCTGFKPVFVQSDWKGRFEDQEKIDSTQPSQDAGKTQMTVGKVGECSMEVKSVSAKQIQIDYEVSIHQPKELEGCYFQVILPGQLVQTGGKFSADANGFKPLPAKPQKGFLFSKAAKSFTWTNGLGKGLKITLGSNLAVQFQDSRQWGLPWYELMIWVPNSAKSTKSHLTFKIEPILSNQTVKPFVDRFGQAVSKRWPGKVTDEKELLQDVQKEEIFLKSKTPPARDEFGGWAGSREKYNLQATGFFRTQKIGNRWWLIDPAGNVYFSLASFFIACDTATVINNRDHLFEWLPDIHAEPWNSASWKDSEGDCFSFYSANLIRKFGPKWYEKWVELSKKRWNAWGLNSTSAFSAQLPKIPYTVYLTLVDQAAPTPPGSPMPDVFDPDFPAKLDALCKEKIAPLKNDPLLLGIFFNNEQHIHQLGTAVSSLDGKAAIKQRFVEFLRSRYSSIQAFNLAWNLQVTGFDTLKSLSFHSTTPAAQKDTDAFLEIYLDRYGSILRTTVKKYDPNHLLIGFRLLPTVAANATIVRTLGKYMDVQSVNYYTNRISEAYLKQVYENSGEKPLLLSEWGFGTSERGHIGGTRDVANQQERGYAYRDYVETAAALPFVVGCHWFEYTDMSLTGRPWGGANAEAFNTGLVDMTDRPYAELIDALIKTNYQIYDVATGKIHPFDMDAHLKNAPATAKKDQINIYRKTTPIEIDGGINEWLNREPSVVLTGRNAVFGSVQKARDIKAEAWLQWDDEYLYLALRVAESTPLSNIFQGTESWNGDAVELFFNNKAQEKRGTLQAGDWQVLINPGCPEKNVPPVSWLIQKSRPLQNAVLKSYRKANPTEWYLEAKIPFNNFESFIPKPDLTINFDLAIDSNDEIGKVRTVQLMWHGADDNSYNSINWGKAKFLP